MSWDWEKFTNDEIFGIWASYLRTETPRYCDPLNIQRSFRQSIRITPMEMMKLVEELIKRLDKKDSENERTDTTTITKD